MSRRVESTLNFGKAIRHFVDAGIPARALLPIAPKGAKLAEEARLKPHSLGKAPGRYDPQHGVWLGLGGAFVQRGVTSRTDRAEFATWPTSNVGMLGRFAPAIDSDAESEDARRLVERVVFETFGDDAGIAKRIRGGGPRRLYAFRCASPGDESRVVHTRHIHYRLKDEPEHVVHKLDIIGAGNQYLIAGIHPSGDAYEWAADADLASLFATGEIEIIEDVDIERFIEAFQRAVEAAGGMTVSSRGSSMAGELRDYSNEEPIIPVSDILEGLARVPNTEANLPDRDDFVGILSSIRAALGREADAYSEDVEAWACLDPEWCPPEYFEPIWRSLDRGVRVDRDRLNREFRRHGVFVFARSIFPDDIAQVNAEIRKHQRARGNARKRLLAEVARNYIFGQVNTRTDDNSPRVRPAADVDTEWQAWPWWNMESHDRAGLDLLTDIQQQDGWAKDKPGFWKFLRDLEAVHPEIFYSGETAHPHHDFGEMVREEDEQGKTRYRINTRHLSRVQRIARQHPRNIRQSERDLRIILEFMHRIFGKHTAYELDTLASMVQSGKRPGHMLFLVGDQGTGKSLYAQMLIAMFDGTGAAGGGIDGTKLTNESARRFVFAKMEGRRILNIKELPEGSKTNMTAVTSSLKKLVDPGPDGDYFLIEEKGKDVRPVQNFARVVMTSNYQNAIQVEVQDRRIFYVLCGINSENKPEDAYYADLVAIITDPSRLATFWRYLATRDISGYKVAAPPPHSLEKQEAQIAAMTDPWQRHAEAAMILLQYAGRWIFDLAEFSELMTTMAENEERNTGGSIADCRKYSFKGSAGPGGKALKRISRLADKFGSFKSGSTRLPTIYVFRSAKDRVAELGCASREEVLEALRHDRERNPLSREHPISMFSGRIMR